MSQPFATLSARETPGRLFVGVVVIVAFVFAWFGVRWQLGSMLAELTPPGDPTAKYIADAASDLASRDPLAAWLKADSEKDLFTPEDVDPSLQAFERVVRLAP